MGNGRPGAGVEALRQSIRIRFTANGVRQYLTLSLPPTPSNLRAAARVRRDIVAEIAAGVFDIRKYQPDETGDGQAPFFEAYARRWVEAISVSRSTRFSYRSAMNTLWIPALGGKRINAITHTDVLETITTATRRLSAKSLNNYRSCLSELFAAAVADKLLAVDPTANIKPLKVQKKLADPFSGDEMEQVLGHMHARYDEQVWNYFEFAFCSGIRPSEEIAARWSSVDWQRRKIEISRAKVLSVTKDTKTYTARTIDLNTRAMAVLERQRAHTFMRGPDSEIFYNPKTGNPWASSETQRVDYFIPTLRALGLRHRDCYQTRHTYATTMLMGGAPLAYVSKQLGHASVATTLKSYYRWIEDADKGASAAIANTIFGHALATKGSKLLKT